MGFLIAMVLGALLGAARAADMAATHRLPSCSDAGRVQAALAKAGFRYRFFGRDADGPYLVWDKAAEARDPGPLVREALDAACRGREDRRARLGALAEKWEKSALSAEEKDELLRLLVADYLQSRRPS